MKDRGFGWTAGMCVGTVIVAVIALGMFFQQRRTNAQLQAELTARANGQWVAADHDTTSRAERNEGLSQAEKIELMRLRNEVTQLRTSAAAARESVKEILENRTREERVKSARQNSSADGQFEFRQSDLVFRGYAMPEDAYISALAAMKNGDVQTMLNSMTAEERARWEQLNEGKTPEEIQARFQKEFGAVHTIRITGEEQVSPTELVMEVEMVRPFTKRVRMNLEGNEWKAGAPINQNSQSVAMANAQPPTQAGNPNGESEAYDPLAFYRKNPELMKRYFPHLYKADLQQQDPTAQPQEIQQGQPQQPAMNPEIMRRYFPHLQQQKVRDGQGGTLPPEPSP
jgi:hypothetical protein